jgi:hypothetical protein
MIKPLPSKVLQEAKEAYIRGPLHFAKFLLEYPQFATWHRVAGSEQIEQIVEDLELEDELL